MAQNVSKTTTDHDTIRRWVEERGGSPAEVEATAGEGQTGIIRIDFPGWSGEGQLRRIEWDQWFEKFDHAGLAFVYEDETAAGERSNFNKLVARETAQARAEGVRTSRRAAGRAKGARATARKTASRGGGRKSASRGGPRRKATAAAGGKRRAGGQRVATRAAAARTTGGTSRAGGRRGAKRRGGGRTSRRSR